MEKCRFAIVAGQLGVGGAERQLYLWLSNLDRDLFEPSVITLNPDRGDCWESSIRELGIPLIGESHRGNWVARLRHIVQLLRSFNPQLIHGWNLFASPYAGVAGWITGAKSIGSFRGSPKAFQAQGMVARLPRHLVDCFLVNSATTARDLTANGFVKPNQIRVVPNAIDSSTQTRVNARNMLHSRFGVNVDSVWIGSVGRFIAGKRLDLLVQTMRSIQARQNNVHLFLVGDGPERGSLRETVLALNLGNSVTFTGVDPDVRNWLSAFDVFCFTSLDEGLPNVVMEAAAASVPVLAWRTPFLEELLQQDVSCSLVTPGDVSAFESALTLLIQQGDLRRRLGDAARVQIMTQFGIDRFVKNMTSVYMDVLNPN